MDGWDAIAASAVPLAGGYGGETFAVAAGGEDAVLRLYLRDPARASVDAALLRLVRGLLPVPRVLDAKPDGSPEDPPYVLTERLPGVNLAAYLPTASVEHRRRVGEQLGELLVRLSGMPFLTGGLFVGPRLTVEPFGPGDLRQWFDGLAEAIALPPEQAEGLSEVLDDAEDLAAGGVDRVCLAHSDFNPKNLLVDPETAVLTGLIDWEFAHAGSPYADLGNLLRFATDPVLDSAALAVVRRHGPGLGDNLQARARAADLWSLLELAARGPANPVTRAARDLVERIAVTRDLAGGRPDLERGP